MESSTQQILTPDQRLRVFVSSTLQELAEERSVVKTAVQNIHLIPVMFELGARPHAPRDLYRQYLAQSQIFVGVYWDRYGWVAPEETISGLEDEYNRSGNLPKLIYIKESNGQREERLTQLLNRIRQDDKVSYKSFRTSEELGNLIINDLALLLTERFNLTMQSNLVTSEFKAIRSIPAVPNNLIGRENDVETVTTMLRQESIRLVTLTGPGGIGKTRLAIETAHQLQNEYPDGVVYVPLAPVRDHTLVPETISYVLGIKVSGGNVLESLKLFLQDKNFLLVLDNFEQVIEAASIIDDLLFAAPCLKILVTSRERLSLSFEHIYAVPTLLDTFTNSAQHQENNFPPAIELFIKRAKAVKPSFEVTDQNREIIFEICRRLEGLPLAIELAAGQINLFGPSILLQKLDHRLDVLKGNFRDIPDRQKTIRNTIEWSFDLLTPNEQKLLLHMSLYNAGCLLCTVESIGAGDDDVYDVLESLINKSLLIKQDEEFQVRFQMLETVREFAIEILKERNQLERLQQKQADYYLVALQGLKLQKNKIDQVEMLRYLEREHTNIRQAMNFLMMKKDVRKITEIAWNLWLFWWVNAHTKEGYTWLKKTWEMNKEQPQLLDEYTLSLLATNVGFMSFMQRDFATFQESIGQHLDMIFRQDDDELIGTACLIMGVVSTIMKNHTESDRILKIGLEKFQKLELTTGITLTLTALGRNANYAGNRITEAKDYYTQSLVLSKQESNDIAVILALDGLALCETMEKNPHAKVYLREVIQLSQKIHFYEALAWSLEIWSLVSVNENKMGHAITLMGAVDHLRNKTHLPLWEDLQAIILQAKADVEKKMDPAAFAEAWNKGANMNLDKMVAFAVEGGSDALSPQAQLILRRTTATPQVRNTSPQAGNMIGNRELVGA